MDHGVWYEKLDRKTGKYRRFVWNPGMLDYTEVALPPKKVAEPKKAAVEVKAEPKAPMTTPAEKKVAVVSGEKRSARDPSVGVYVHGKRAVTSPQTPKSSTPAGRTAEDGWHTAEICDDPDPRTHVAYARTGSGISVYVGPEFIRKYPGLVGGTKVYLRLDGEVGDRLGARATQLELMGFDTDDRAAAPTSGY
jgi:hypothetical protein